MALNINIATKNKTKKFNHKIDDDLELVEISTKNQNEVLNISSTKTDDFIQRPGNDLNSPSRFTATDTPNNIPLLPLTATNILLVNNTIMKKGPGKNTESTTTIKEKLVTQIQTQKITKESHVKLKPTSLNCKISDTSAHKSVKIRNVQEDSAFKKSIFNPQKVFLVCQLLQNLHKEKISNQKESTASSQNNVKVDDDVIFVESHLNNTFSTNEGTKLIPHILNRSQRSDVRNVEKDSTKNINLASKEVQSRPQKILLIGQASKISQDRNLVNAVLNLNALENNNRKSGTNLQNNAKEVDDDVIFVKSQINENKATKPISGIFNGMQSTKITNAAMDSIGNNNSVYKEMVPNQQEVHLAYQTPDVFEGLNVPNDVLKSNLTNQKESAANLQNNAKEFDDDVVFVGGGLSNSLSTNATKSVPYVLNTSLKKAKTSLKLPRASILRSKSKIIVSSEKSTAKSDIKDVKNDTCIPKKILLNIKSVTLPEKSHSKNNGDKSDNTPNEKTSNSSALLHQEIFYSQDDVLSSDHPKQMSTSQPSKTPTFKLDKNVSNELLTKSLQKRWVHKDLSLKKQGETLEDDTTFSNSIIPVRGDKDQDPLYYVVYSVEHEDTIKAHGSEKNPDFLESVAEELREDRRTPDDITTPIESHETENNSDFSEAAPEERPCVVTPVDISAIMNKTKKLEVKLTGRCRCASLKNRHFYNKGFTRRERERPICLDYLQESILSEEEKIEVLERKQEMMMNYIHCEAEPSNFLPEIVQCKSEENDNFTVEYNIEEYLREEICNSPALPAITEVISEVNEEVMQLKRKSKSCKELKMKLEKPEAALKLIQKGLQLIKSWSQETSVEHELQPKSREKKENAVKQRGRSRKVMETRNKKKRGTHKRETSAERELQPKSRKKVENAVKRRGRPKKVMETRNSKTRGTHKKQSNKRRNCIYKLTRKGRKPNKREITHQTVKSGIRKRKVEESCVINDTSDLLIVRKVDILNKKPRR